MITGTIAVKGMIDIIIGTMAGGKPIFAVPDAVVSQVSFTVTVALFMHAPANGKSQQLTHDARHRTGNLQDMQGPLQ